MSFPAFYAFAAKQTRCEEMIKRNTAAEVLPRLLWGAMGIGLFLGQYLTDWPPTLSANITMIVVGFVLSGGGFLLWMYVTHYMRVGGALSVKEKKLATGGPFRYVRHPMYVSVYVMLVGIGLLFFFSWAWFAVMVGFIPIWYVDCKMEERMIIKLYEAEYFKYKKKTGMFFPKICKR